jgi:hypothetical protein
VRETVLAIVQLDFSKATWEALRRFGVGSRPAGKGAEEVGLCVNADLRAKSQMLEPSQVEAGELLG